MKLLVTSFSKYIWFTFFLYIKASTAIQTSLSIAPGISQLTWLFLQVAPQVTCLKAGPDVTVSHITAPSAFPSSSSLCYTTSIN